MLALVILLYYLNYHAERNQIRMSNHRDKVWSHLRLQSCSYVDSVSVEHCILCVYVVRNVAINT